MSKIMDRKVIFVIGAPGAGKGTQAKFLVEKTGFYHFVTSKEGKDYIKAHRDDLETLKQEELYKKGILFEPKWLVRVQKERVGEILEGGVKGIVFDGSPRTVYEAENLPAFLSGLVGKENISAIDIVISEEELKKRAEERLVCDKNESHMVSTRLDPNIKIGDKCLQCDGALKKRDLDLVVGERIKEYNERTAPAIDCLKKNYKVFTINGEQPVEKVHEDIMKAL